MTVAPTLRTLIRRPGLAIARLLTVSCFVLSRCTAARAIGNGLRWTLEPMALTQRPADLLERDATARPLPGRQLAIGFERAAFDDTVGQPAIAHGPDRNAGEGDRLAARRKAEHSVVRTRA